MVLTEHVQTLKAHSLILAPIFIEIKTFKNIRAYIDDGWPYKKFVFGLHIR